jgi:transcriptional regulator with XRE-family HTH domain
MAKKTTSGSRLAERIRQEFARREMTGYTIARETGITQPSVYRFLSGQEPTLATAEKYLELLGWTVGPGKPRSKS